MRFALVVAVDSVLGLSGVSAAAVGSVEVGASEVGAAEVSAGSGACSLTDISSF